MSEGLGPNFRLSSFRHFTLTIVSFFLSKIYVYTFFMPPTSCTGHQLIDGVHNSEEGNLPSPQAVTCHHLWLRHTFCAHKIPTRHDATNGALQSHSLCDGQCQSFERNVSKLKDDI